VTTAFNIQDLGPQNTEKSRNEIAQSVHAASAAVTRAMQHVRYALDHLEYQRQKLTQLRTLTEEEASQLEEISRRMAELKGIPDLLSAVQEAHHAQLRALAPAPVSSISRRPTS
jgi:DNA repair ATPase RecN